MWMKARNGRRMRPKNAGRRQGVAAGLSRHVVLVEGWTNAMDWGKGQVSSVTREQASKG